MAEEEKTVGDPGGDAGHNAIEEDNNEDDEDSAMRRKCDEVDNEADEDSAEAIGEDAPSVTPCNIPNENSTMGF